jgi:hypothetical protein
MTEKETMGLPTGSFFIKAEALFSNWDPLINWFDEYLYGPVCRSPAEK